MSYFTTRFAWNDVERDVIRRFLTKLNKDRPTNVTCFIFYSACFECYYIHLQELATVCGYTALVRCVLVLRCGSAGVVWYPYAG